MHFMAEELMLIFAFSREGCALSALLLLHADLFLAKALSQGAHPQGSLVDPPQRRTTTRVAWQALPCRGLENPVNSF